MAGTIAGCVSAKFGYYPGLSSHTGHCKCEQNDSVHGCSGTSLLLHRRTNERNEHLQPQLPIRTLHLVNSGVGRVVYFYTKVDESRITPGIKRQAHALVGTIRGEGEFVCIGLKFFNDRGTEGTAYSFTPILLLVNCFCNRQVEPAHRQTESGL